MTQGPLMVSQADMSRPQTEPPDIPACFTYKPCNFDYAACCRFAVGQMLRPRCAGPTVKAEPLSQGAGESRLTRSPNTKVRSTQTIGTV